MYNSIAVMKHNLEVFSARTGSEIDISNDSVNIARYKLAIACGFDPKDRDAAFFILVCNQFSKEIAFKDYSNTLIMKNAMAVVRVFNKARHGEVMNAKEGLKQEAINTIISKDSNNLDLITALITVNEGAKLIESSLP